MCTPGCREPGWWASCRHTRSGGNHGKQPGLEPTTGALAAAGALAVSVHYAGCWFAGHWCTAVRVSVRGQAGACGHTAGGVGCRGAQWYRPGAGGRARSRTTSSFGDPGCRHTLLWLRGLSTGPHLAVEASDWLAWRHADMQLEEPAHKQ